MKFLINISLTLYTVSVLQTSQDFEIIISYSIFHEKTIFRATFCKMFCLLILIKEATVKL